MSRPPYVPPESEQDTVIGRSPAWRSPGARGSEPLPLGFEETVIGHPPSPRAGSAPLATGSDSDRPAPSRIEATHPADGSLVGVVLAERYELVRLIGEGGMGLVYEARHLGIDRRFAVKVLASEFCSDRAQVERFMREARTTAKIEHENIVEINDVGAAPNGSVFFVMEYLQGEDLGAMIDRERSQPWARTQHLMLQLCAAVSAAHAHGIVHRDLKPQNCFRTTRRGDSDFIKVLDFGIAKFLGEEHQAGKKLTRSGQIFGTPEYMSPEQVRGMPADPRMDVYAAGVIMFELLTGRTPFEGDAPLEILAKHLRETIPDASAVRSGPPLPMQVDGIIRRALAKDVADRFQSAEELAAAIRAVDPTSLHPGLGVAVPRSAPTGTSRRLSTVNLVALVAGVVMLTAAVVIGLIKFTGVFSGAVGALPDGTPTQAVASDTPETAPPTPASATASPSRSEVATASGSRAPSTAGAELPDEEVDGASRVSESDGAKVPPVDSGAGADAEADEVTIITPTPPSTPPAGDRVPDRLPRLPTKKIHDALATVDLKSCLFRGDGWNKGEKVTVAVRVAEKTGKLTVRSVTHSKGKVPIADCVEGLLKAKKLILAKDHAAQDLTHVFSR